MALLAAVLVSTSALADDAGGDVPDASSDATPVACDGSLCETSNDATCGMSRGAARHGGLPGAAMIVLLLVGILVRRAKSQRLTTAMLMLGVLAISTPASAETGVGEDRPAVDVAVTDPEPPQRVLAVEWNPLSLLFVSKLSANVVFAPFEHHAVVVSPFYAQTKTVPFYVFDDAGQGTRLPVQRFTGFGGELGYRYYTGRGGLRGFFVGPSLLVGSFTAKAENGTKTSFVNFGAAADAGYEALLADRLALSLGGGLQYVSTSKSIPDQQLPARVYANRGVAPRVLLSIGWSF
jgi:hypothetical protein